MKTASRDRLQRTFRDLYDHFGAQGWWPTTPPGQTRPRYFPGASRRQLSERDQWEIVVGAVLTQNTSWRNVVQALEALSSRGALELDGLLALDPDELARLVRPALYYNQKSARLRGIAQYIRDHYGGSTAALLARPAAALRPELLALKGIGPETADSIMLYAARYPFFVVDTYTRRICGRLGLAPAAASYADLQALFMDKLPADAVLFSEFHALLVKHATEYCRARPVCESCCLRARCPAGRRANAESARAAAGPGAAAVRGTRTTGRQRHQ